jgi:hypothetical protein
MHIACAECGGERFHLIIKADGHTELVCYNHGDHLAELGMDEEPEAETGPAD